MEFTFSDNLKDLSQARHKPCSTKTIDFGTMSSTSAGWDKAGCFSYGTCPEMGQEEGKAQGRSGNLSMLEWTWTPTAPLGHAFFQALQNKGTIDLCV